MNREWLILLKSADRQIPVEPVRGCHVDVSCSKLEAFDGNGEHISDAALGLDHARGARIALELAPETKNLHVDAAIKDILVNAGCLQKVFSAKRTLRGFEEGDQRRVFALGQRYWGADRVNELPGPAIELPAGKSKAATLWIARRRFSNIEPPQDRANPREQFAQVERLGQIVVGAEFQTNDPILGDQLFRENSGQ